MYYYYTAYGWHFPYEVSHIALRKSISAFFYSYKTYYRPSGRNTFSRKLTSRLTRLCTMHNGAYVYRSYLLLREAPCASKNYSVGVSYVFLDFRRVRVCIRSVIFSPDTTSLFLSLLFRSDRSLVTLVAHRFFNFHRFRIIIASSIYSLNLTSRIYEDKIKN